MKKTTKLAALAAIATICCAAGMQTRSSSPEGSKSALALANVEAIASSETVSDCEYYCIEDKMTACVLYYSGCTTYCLNKRQRK